MPGSSSYKSLRFQSSVRWLLVFSLAMLAGFAALIYQQYQRQGTLTNTGWYTILIWGGIAYLLIVGAILQLKKDFILRKKAEAELAKNEQQYRNLIQNINAVIYTTDVRGNITFVNKYVNQLTGYTGEEMIGKPFSLLLDPKDIDRITAFYFDQLQQRIPSTSLELEIIPRSGRKKRVRQHVQLLFEEDQLVGFQCLVRDIDEQKRMQQQLDASELKRKEYQYRLEAIIEHTTSLVFIKDPQGRYVMANKRYKEIFGLSDELMIGKTDRDLTSPALAAHYQRLDEEVLRTRRPVESEEVVDGPNGPMSLLLVKFPLLDQNNNVFGISGIATDITDRVQYQEQLILARKEAEEARKMQELFLANMSHEIRTPMNGILGMTQLLQDTELTEQQKEFATIINRSVNNLLVIINDLLDFSKIRAGKLTLEKATFNIREVLNNIKVLFTHQLSEKSLFLEIRIDEKVPPLLVGDPYRLNQILVNLVGNSIKFTESGGVIVQVTAQEQTADTVLVHFTITDSGIGIESGKLTSIFESFVQADSNTTRRFGGTGLGLAICKDLVELQNGHIEAKSVSGIGTIFIFQIPYEHNGKAEEAIPINQPTAILKGKRILIVEDNEVNQKLMSHVLRKVEAGVDIVGNGQLAIDRLKNDPDYDLIFMDLQMPVMDGIEATRYIRKELQLDIPIIVITATAMKSDQDRSFEAGANDFMLKPFNFDDLYKRLTRLLYEPGKKREEAPVAHSDIQQKLYDLSLLEDLDDQGSMLEILLLFLKDAPGQFQMLQEQVQQQDWESVARSAHKLKGAVSMLQCSKLVTLLAMIDSTAKTGRGTDGIDTQMEAARGLFDMLVIQIRMEADRIRKEMKATGAN